MILAALTPERHEFVYLDDVVAAVDVTAVSQDADLVAITSMTAQADRAYELANGFRNFGVTVVMGGIHCAVRPEEAARYCDAILLGLGEHTWPAMLEDWENGRLKKVYDAKDYPPVEEFVSPRVDVIDHTKYLAYPIQATRGCPNHCEFCSIAYSSGHKYRMKPIEQFVADVKAFEACNRPGILGAEHKDYYIVDDNLYVNREYTLKLFRAMKGLNITWHGQGTINAANDEEVVAAMAESGCRSYNMGFESLSEESLAEMGKPKHNYVPSYQQALLNLKKHGINAGAYFVFGFDHDDPTVFERTLKFVFENKLLRPVFSCLTPYPGTELAKRLNRDNRIFLQGWHLYNHWNCVLTPKRMTTEELQSGFYWATREMSDFEFIKDCLRHFWSFGPWPNNPPLKPVERLALLYLGLRFVMVRGCAKYGLFLWWAARQKNAAEFRSIIGDLYGYEIGMTIPRHCKNPADKYRALPPGRLRDRLDAIAAATPAPAQQPDDTPTGAPAA
jgi:radical SAM superfamily enzyme YgiQ (UPF0313 family)